MEPLLRRWKLLALKYKRETSNIHEKITELIIGMSKEEIRKFNLGNYIKFISFFISYLDSILTRYEEIVLEAHDTLEDVIAGILNDDEEEEDDEIMDTNEGENEEKDPKNDSGIETDE